MSGLFQFVALEPGQFIHLFEKDDEALKAIGMKRMVADEKPGFPCRVSLADAEVGETVLLLPFTHHDVASPYRASGPIFVRGGVSAAAPSVGEIPQMFIHRLLSVRAYNAKAMMIDADVVDGAVLKQTILQMLRNEKVSYLHTHNAKPGCFNCKVVRA